MPSLCFCTRHSAMHYFNTSRANALFHPVIITVLWGVGIWLATPRNLEQTQASSADTVGDCTSASRTRDAVDYPGDRSDRCCICRRASLSPRISYTNPRIEFFASNDPSPDPYGIYNLLTSSIPGNASAKRYVHARVTLSHAPGQRSRTIPTVCGLTDSAGKRLMESKKLLVVVPDAVSGPKLESRTSWIAVSRRGPWEPGLYRVDCTLPRGEVAGASQCVDKVISLLTQETTTEATACWMDRNHQLRGGVYGYRTVRSKNRRPSRSSQLIRARCGARAGVESWLERCSSGRPSGRLHICCRTRWTGRQ